MPTRAEYLIGVDAGTQSTTACAWTTRGRLVARGRSRLTVRSPHPGWAEQNPRAWWTSARKAIRQAAERIDPAHVLALGLAYQRETFSLVDGRGRFLRPGILWLDVRADEEVRRLEREVGADAYHRRTGKPLDVTSAPARLAWLARHEPASLAAAARWVDVGGELAYRLTGRYATCAAGTDTCGLINLRDRCWIGPYLDRVGLQVEQMPEIVSGGEVIGHLRAAAARATGLPGGLPVVAAGGDGNVFALGVGSVRPYGLSLTLGTSIVLGLTCPKPVLSPMFRTLISPAGGYLLECVLQSGTYLLRWFAERFAPQGEGSEAYWDRRIAGIAAGSDGLVTLPHWWGTRFPVALPEARGVTLGWSDHHTPAHLYRSLLEGLTLEVRRFDRELRRRFGRRVARLLRVGGGGADSAHWPRMLADVLDRPVGLARQREATALGAGILAGVGVGRFSDVREGCQRMTGLRQTLQPRKAQARFYARLFERVYEPLLDATAEMSARLRSLQPPPGDVQQQRAVGEDPQAG